MTGEIQVTDGDGNHTAEQPGVTGVTGVDADLATLRDALEGRLLWEGVGPRPWWGAYDRVEAELSRLKAAAKLRGQYRDEWRERAEAAAASGRVAARKFTLAQEDVRILEARCAQLEAEALAFDNVRAAYDDLIEERDAARAELDELRDEYMADAGLRTAAEAEASRLREMLHGPDRVGQMWRRVEAAEARCAELEQERDAAMDAVGLPRTASLDDLIRHHRGNAATAAGFDQIAAEARLGEAHQECARLQQALATLLNVTVSRWHEWQQDGRTLAEFMELTDEQYLMFAERGSAGYVEALAGHTPQMRPTPADNRGASSPPASAGPDTAACEHDWIWPANVVCAKCGISGGDMREGR
jgi:hypothetical protein